MKKLENIFSIFRQNLKFKIQNLKFLFFLIPTLGFSQEMLLDLKSNSILEQNRFNPSAYKTASLINTIELPFLDDFSKESSYPDTSLWLDNNVFINRDYPISPITLGVATFDGLDFNGQPYDFSAPALSSSLADILTSKPINLFAADSVYLSFYYQAQGRGDDPEDQDSLVLEFKSPDKNWTRVWYKNGYQPATSDSAFIQVMIAIKDTSYLKKGFSFRFKNYATVSGNLDHWHIDYVYLNKLRNINDTVMDDVAFVYNPSSVLKNYYSMPWNQFNNSDLKPTLRNFIRNNDTSQAPLFYKYYVDNSGGIKVDSLIAGFWNVSPFYTNGYHDHPAHATPPFNYVFPAMTDTSSYIVEHILNTTPDLDRWNDTARFYQKFSNYYAYDDGTAEIAYALKGHLAQLAYQFTLNTPDTLRAVQMFFNPMLRDASNFNFRLTVWNDNNGSPGTILFQDSVTHPQYEPGHNGFYTYFTDDTTIVVSGTFYIGWLQIDDEFLNIGFDLNDNSQNKIFKNTSGQWSNSNFKGSLMMRPVFGKKRIPLTGISSFVLDKSSFIISPNPAKDYISIHFNTPNDLDKNSMINVFDAYGRLVLTGMKMVDNALDISSLSSGIYFVQLKDQKNNYLTKKLMIMK